MSNPVLRFFAVSLFALGVTSVRADVVTLKGGEKLEGKITEETATELHMNVQVSAGIVDERTIPRADVDKIEKTAPDDSAWVVLKTFQPGANSLPVAQYDRFITPLKAFTTQYPKSAHSADAQKSLAAFEDEKKRVEAGGLKLDGNWLSKEEAQAERYQINGLLTLNFMRSEQARGDLISGLNAFDILEKQFPNSKSYPDAVELALKMLNTLKAQAAARVAAIPAEKAADEKAIAAAVEPARTQMKDSMVQARVAAEAAMSAAVRQGLKWPPFIASSDASMRQIADKSTGELTRLGGIDLAKYRQSTELADKAKKQIVEKDFAGAEASLTKARTLWEQNEVLPRLVAEVTTAKAAATAAAKPKATPIPVAAEPEVKNSGATGSNDEAPPGNPWFMIVVGSLVAIIVIVGFVVYRNIKGKANQVLE
jgi:hypothetical protein